MSGRRGSGIAMVAACPFPAPRGTPVRIHRIAETLARRGHDLHVVTYHLGDDRPLPFPVHRIPRVPTYRRLSPGPTYQKLMVLDLLLARRLRGLVRSHRIDLVHAHHYEGLLVALALRGADRRPIVYDAHTLLASELPFYSLGLPRAVKRGLGRWLDRRLPGRADHVVAVTETIRTSLVGSGTVEAARVSVVPNGVEAELFTPPPRRDAISREPTLLFAGNLAAYQGMELLLRAFRRVLDDREARLVLVTESPFDDYEPLARSLGLRERIRLETATLDELPARLHAADVAANPRVACDGIPQKLLNYMAAALPIVSFEGSATVLEHDRTGWIVENGDVDGFARAILTLLDEPARADRLGRAARSQVMASHTWDTTADGIEAVYETLLARR